jgi:ABC-2 type transport system permease protein
MLQKILAITWKELYTTYTDRSRLLVMIATPLALATIIGLAFSGFITGGGNDVPVRDIPVAIVNLDAGVTANAQAVNNGEIFADLLVPPDGVEDPDNTLHQLTNAVALNSAEEARAAVDRGEYSVAIIIPAGFSAGLTITPTDLTLEPTSLEVYYNPARQVSANIIRSITESIVNQIITGNVTIAATVQQMIELTALNPALSVQMLAGDFNPDFGPAFDPVNNPVRIVQQTVAGEAVAFNPLVYVGAANAIFFMMFTAQGGANNLLEEQRDWTLQRLLVTPTPRIIVLLGKLIGTFVTCVVQVSLLLIFLTLVGSLLSGRFQIIWGTNIISIALVVIAASLAAAGMGTLITALVRSPEQGNIVGSVVVMAMGVLGGTFFDVSAVPVLGMLSRLTITYWGTNALTKLSLNQNDVGLNLALLLGLGAVMFGIGLLIFNRRMEA